MNAPQLAIALAMLALMGGLVYGLYSLLSLFN
jgi:hypothetical protein